MGTLDAWLAYEHPTHARCPAGAPVVYRGQTQKWLLLEFTGADAEVDLAAGGQPEFSEWSWKPLDELPRSVVAFKRGVYASVARAFCPRIAALGAERAARGRRAA